MQRATRRVFVSGFGVAVRTALAQDWKPLFDGKTMRGWEEAPFPGRGVVSIREGMIHLGKGRMTGVRYTGAFPRVNYEVRFEAVRLEGNDFFAGVIFPVKESYCSWINGGWDGATVGLSNLDGYDASENETSASRDFARGRWYSFVLAVTAGRIRASIDGAVVIDLDTTGRKLELRFDDTDLATPLGFASYATAAGIRNIAWRPLG